MVSIGEFKQAITLTPATADHLEPGLGDATQEYLSVYGMLHLTGAAASSRREDRSDTTTFLSEADDTADAAWELFKRAGCLRTGNSL